MLSFISVRNWVRTAFVRLNNDDNEAETDTGKGNVEDNQQNGTLVTTVSEESDNAPPVLSEKQKQNVRASWQLVHSEIEHFGSVAMLNLFEHKLEFKKAFAAFKDMPIEQIRGSPLIKMHAMSVLHVVERLINRLDEPQNWKTMIDPLCRRHVGFNVIPSLAPDVTAYCLGAMQPILEQRGLTDKDTIDAWSAIFTWLGEEFERSTQKYKSLSSTEIEAKSHS